VREPNVATRSAAAVPDTRETTTMQDGAGHEHGAATSFEAVPAGQPAKTLSADPLDSPAGTSVMDAQRSAEVAEEMAAGGHDGHGDHGGSHGTGTYRHVDAGREPGAPGADETAEPHHHHGAAPTEPTENTEETAAVVYACPMHPEVTSNEPGTCSKCGMVLVERREE